MNQKNKRIVSNIVKALATNDTSILTKSSLIYLSRIEFAPRKSIESYSSRPSLHEKRNELSNSFFGVCSCAYQLTSWLASMDIWFQRGHDLTETLALWKDCAEIFVAIHKKINTRIFHVKSLSKEKHWKRTKYKKHFDIVFARSLNEAYFIFMRGKNHNKSNYFVVVKKIRDVGGFCKYGLEIETKYLSEGFKNCLLTNGILSLR